MFFLNLPQSTHHKVHYSNNPNLYLLFIMDNSTSALTFRKLQLQRIKQIQRQGVFLTFHLRSYPYQKYFSFDPAQTCRIIDMVKQNKYPLELCDDEGATVLKLKPSDLYLPKEREEGKLMIASDIFFGRGRIDDGVGFYLAKANPTLRAYKGIYSFHENEYQSQEFHQSTHIISYFKGIVEEVEPVGKVDFPWQADLNTKQNEALSKCAKNGLTFIKGPPGCGKTKTIARLCRLFLERQMKVIVGAVSNTGNLSIVRELIEQMSGYNTPAPLVHNYSHLAETDPEQYFNLLAQSYDHYIPYSVVFFPPFELKQDEELPPLVRLYSFDTIVIKNMVMVSSGSGISTAYILHEYRRLKAREKVDNKFYAIFMQATIITLARALIVIATTVKAKSLNAKLSQEYHFRPKVAILDEASQSSCSDTLCYLKLDVEKLVLVGDDKQLNPTVISNDKLLKESFFCNFGQKREDYFCMLNRQYRMHPAISRISNTLFYNREIEDGVTPEDRATQVQPFAAYPVMFVNCSHPQREGAQQTGLGNKKTYCNPHEVYIIRVYLDHFPRQQLGKVGIVTPYVDQLKLLQRQFAAEREYGLTIRTCDGFQGGQREYIFISLVRSNPEGNIGFCGQESRINVSVTRARRGMMIVGSAATFVGVLNYWGAIAQYLYGQNAYFQFDAVISEQTIEKIMNRSELVQKEVDGNGHILKEQKGVNGGEVTFMGYEQYRHQFMKVYPHESEELMQAHYQEYIRNLHNYYYEQHYQNINGKKESQGRQTQMQKIIAMLQQHTKEEVAQGQEEEQEVEKLLKFNKTEVRQLRRSDLFSITGKKQRTVQSYIEQIDQIFSKLPKDAESIIKHLTPKIQKEFLTHFTTSKPKDPNKQLFQLITLISDKEYPNRHQSQTSNIAFIVKLSLLRSLTSLS